MSFSPVHAVPPSLFVVSVPFQNSSVYCDVSSGTLLPLVPVSLLHQLFLSLHGISHPGVRASRRLLSSRFVWPCLAKDVGLWARSCLRCQQSKIQSHVRSSVPSNQVPGRRFSHMHLDLMGPLPSSQGFSYLLTMIDRTSRMPEAVPLASIITESCTRTCSPRTVEHSLRPLLGRRSAPPLVSQGSRPPASILRAMV